VRTFALTSGRAGTPFQQVTATAVADALPEFVDLLRTAEQR
jgi:hypothetical protein